MKRSCLPVGFNVGFRASLRVADLGLYLPTLQTACKFSGCGTLGFHNTETFLWLASKRSKV